MICSDGAHGPLSSARLKALLEARAAPEESARDIVNAALDAGGKDNATALVLDVIDLPAADEDELARAAAGPPILPLPSPGDIVDGFTLGEAVSDSRYSRLHRAADPGDGRALALKFPQPRVAEENSYRLAFVRDAWVAARARSPWIGEIIELPPGRQTRLYSVMPYYEGETLEQRLKRSPVPLEDGVGIAAPILTARPSRS